MRIEFAHRLSLFRPGAFRFSLFATSSELMIESQWQALTALLNSARVIVVRLVAAIAAAGFLRRWRAHAATQMHGGLANAPTL